MEKIVKMVAEKAGISEDQALAAVNTMADFIKNNMPPAMASQVDSFLRGEGPADMGGIADKLGGFFGKK